MSDSKKSIPSKLSLLLRINTIKLDLQATAKVPALREVAELLANTGCIKDFDAFFNEILERERVSNTALGHDLAIPHARTDHCTDILIGVGRSLEGIDFEAKDGHPVRLIFLIGTPKQMVTDYLKVVGNLARLLRQDSLRQELLDADHPETFINIIRDAETKN